ARTPQVVGAGEVDRAVTNHCRPMILPPDALVVVGILRGETAVSVIEIDDEIVDVVFLVATDEGLRIARAKPADRLDNRGDVPDRSRRLQQKHGVVALPVCSEGIERM